MTSPHHSPSMASSLYPSKAGERMRELQAKAVQRLCLDVFKVACERESGRVRERREHEVLR